MSILVGGIGTSHAPSIAAAYDEHKQNDPNWINVFEGFKKVKDWVNASNIDTIVMVYNDHLNQFKFDAYPTFALGLADQYSVADEGRGARKFAPIPGDVNFSWHLAEKIVAADFDITLCQEMKLDHGAMSILPLLIDEPWKIKVIPIAVNVILYPLPSPRRCFNLGAAIANAIESAPGDHRVAVVASGGLSHQLHGPDFGLTNPEWDKRFMDLVEKEPEILANISHSDFSKRGGSESVEMMLWLAMAGALRVKNKEVHCAHKYYSAPGLTGYGALVLDY